MDEEKEVLEAELAKARRWLKVELVICFAALFFLIFLAGYIYLKRHDNKSVGVNTGQIAATSENDAYLVDIYQATEADQSAYTEIIYMTESFTFDQKTPSRKFYITWNPEGYMAVICVDDANLDAFAPYFQKKADASEALKVYGRAMEMDDLLWDRAGDELEWIYGERPALELIQSAVGSHYLYVEME